MNIQPLPALLLTANFLLPLYRATRGDHVRYVGGTLASIEGDTEGTCSTADEKNFTFHYKHGKLTIPHDRMNSLEYGQKAGRRIGLAIAVTPVALLSKKRKHCSTINYLDENDRQQAAVFELSKGVVRVTSASLEARRVAPAIAASPCPTIREAKEVACRRG